MAGIEAEVLINEARQHYSDLLPYHKFAHAEQVMDRVEYYCRRLEERGVVLRRDLLLIAAAWHDAGYDQDHVALGYETKEHNSAALADVYMELYGYSEEDRSYVREAILGTIHRGSRVGLHAVVLHRADISNMGGPYSSFYANNIALREETVVLHGKRPEWSQWKSGTLRLLDDIVEESRSELPALSKFVNQPLRGALTVGGLMSFDTIASSNADRFRDESDPGLRAA